MAPLQIYTFFITKTNFSSKFFLNSRNCRAAQQTPLYRRYAVSFLSHQKADPSNQLIHADVFQKTAKNLFRLEHVYIDVQTEKRLRFFLMNLLLVHLGEIRDPLREKASLSEALAVIIGSPIPLYSPTQLKRLQPVLRPNLLHLCGLRSPC